MYMCIMHEHTCPWTLRYQHLTAHTCSHPVSALCSKARHGQPPHHPPQALVPTHLPTLLVLVCPRIVVPTAPASHHSFSYTWTVSGAMSLQRLYTLLPASVDAECGHQVSSHPPGRHVPLRPCVCAGHQAWPRLLPVRCPICLRRGECKMTSPAGDDTEVLAQQGGGMLGWGPPKRPKPLDPGEEGGNLGSRQLAGVAMKL